MILFIVTLLLILYFIHTDQMELWSMGRGGDMNSNKNLFRVYFVLILLIDLCNSTVGYFWIICVFNFEQITGTKENTG